MSGEPKVAIVAELSANHLHDLDLAQRTVRAMGEAGATHLKLQTLTPDTMTIDADSPLFRVPGDTPWAGRSLYELYSETALPYEWHRPLIETARECGLEWFSTPYDASAVEFLEQLEAPMYKIASFEITDTPLIESVAARGKPVVISLGVADAGDIQRAVDACRRQGNEAITLLQCTSSYPAPVERANLRVIPNLRETFRVRAGLSDHTRGSAVAVAAVALGASMLEKHFIMDRSLGGPDAAFSMEPAEFAAMVSAVREVERAMGRVDYSLDEARRRARALCRSLFVVRDVPAGGELTPENVRSIRPNHGLHPRHLEEVIGRVAARDLRRGEPLAWEMLAE